MARVLLDERASDRTGVRCLGRHRACEGDGHRFQCASAASTAACCVLRVRVGDVVRRAQPFVAAVSHARCACLFFQWCRARRIDGIGRVLCVPAKRCYPTSSSAPAAGYCGHRRPQNVIDDAAESTRFVKSGINQTVHIRNLAASDRIQSSPEHHEKKARPARRFCSMRSVAQSGAIHRAL